MCHQRADFLLFITLCILLPAALTGCGSEQPTSDASPAPAPAANVQEELPLEVTAAEESEKDTEWGDLKMQFVYGGVAPAPAPIALATTDEYCSQTPVLSDALVVDKETNGLANVFVSLYLGRSETVEPHPSYETAEPNTLTNRNCRFEPHGLFHVAGQPLIIANADKTAHNASVNFGSSGNRAFNETIAAGGKTTREGLDDATRWPVKIRCSMHTWMAAYVMIQDHPYGAVSNSQGEVILRHLPVGEHTLQFWHEGAGELGDIEIDGQAVAWRKGRVKVKIAPGMNTSPVITVPASAID